MTIFAGGAATFISSQQGVYPRGGIYGSGQTPGQTVVTPGGNIGRSSTVQWIDVRDIDMSTLSPRIKQVDVSIKAGLQKLMDSAKGNPSKYPKIAAATLSPSYTDLPIGTVMSAGGLRYKITGSSSIGSRFCGSSKPTSPPVYAGGYYYTDYSSSSVLNCSPPYSGFVTMIYPAVQTNDPLSNLPTTPSSISEFAQKLANSSSTILAPANVFSDYYGEIDDYIKNNPGSVSVIASDNPTQVDTGTLATLPTPATQAQVSAASALAQGANATAAANNAVAVAQGNYNANPTPENAQRLANAQAAAAAAAARQAELQRELDNLDPNEVEDAGDTALTGLGDNEYDGTYEQPEKKGLLGLLQGFVASSPLTSMVRSFTISTSSTESTLSAGTIYGKELNFSFSRWEPFLRLCGAALIIIAHGFAVMVVVRGW
ncbi:hypothetical protein SAMN02745119_03358 [Trichlorobacter thiogenes]|uniref:Uncharacterized protein n=2 Tax=Trichlorobacter thiogenes TaxID=115783 RepID=A0A1T4SAV3_9BACT|nr:hypothetical protein SAMN02745119_03358 [Trichlorobacter thiogenes]